MEEKIRKIYSPFSIAGGAMGLSYHFNSAIPDSVGCILIGGLLGGVAAFMMKTNSAALVGRSIPEDKKQMITEDLEGDIMIRQILDVKAIDMGNGIVRYYLHYYHMDMP